MSKLRALLFLSISAVPLAACGADDVASPGEGAIVVVPPAPAPPPPPPPPAPGQPAANCPAGTTDGGIVGTRRACQLPSRFTQDTTIQNVPGVAYSLVGPVNVGTDCGGDPANNLAGCQQVTLTVQAGTVLFGSAGNDYLVVNRGSRIQAVGTPTSPIIFTARANVAGTATDSSQGLWGGVILLGRAPISDCNTAVPGGSVNCQNIIEGTTGSLYGGASPNDNSGTMQYVQIRYSGFQIAPGNELQGLTTGGVGQLTTLDHIQIHNSSDDGMEFFGGRQNAKYLIVTGADDDSFDTDLGYRGTLQFLIAVQRDSSNGDSMIEADSNGNEDALPRQYTRISNATFIQRGNTQGGNAILLRGGTDYALINSVVVGPQACLDIDATGGTTTRAADAGLHPGVGVQVAHAVGILGAPDRDVVHLQSGRLQRARGASLELRNGIFAGLQPLDSLGKHAVEHPGGPALLLAEVGISRTEGKARFCTNGFFADDLNAKAEVVGHATDHEQLLEILFTKYRHIQVLNRVRKRRLLQELSHAVNASVCCTVALSCTPTSGMENQFCAFFPGCSSHRRKRSSLIKSIVSAPASA